MIIKVDKVTAIQAAYRFWFAWNTLQTDGPHGKTRGESLAVYEGAVSRLSGLSTDRPPSESTFGSVHGTAPGIGGW